MEKIPFTISVRGIEYEGYLYDNDFSDSSLIFYVFIADRIAGNLVNNNSWEFIQVGVRLDKLTENERKNIAKQLGELAVEWYE